MEQALRQVVVVDGDDASPEVMIPVVAVLESMDLPIRFLRPPIGQAAIKATGSAFPAQTRAAIDDADATFFGSTSGPSTAALFYLRWGKQTYANVRPCRYLPGMHSPLSRPDGIDFVIVRENLEDLYLGLEGDIADLDALDLRSPHARMRLADLGPGKYAIKAITERGSERVIRHAFELARRRNGRRKVTVTCKYNMLHVSDGAFRSQAFEIAEDYPDIECEAFIVDDLLCRMVVRPQAFDVVVTPNLYGDILSDGAAGLIGGLGLAPSGCYGDDYAYFESAHGTAPDIAGRNIINPTATLLAAAMMLRYLGLDAAADRLAAAVRALYADATVLTPDQGGMASTTAVCDWITSWLECDS
ncbi:MAG: isocitrate/isopropylmalate dehydrogenase family protein [Gammaproteobacteria bacterium]|nr:MAG: isocitrate/isopropylmalate dehydrogenase family protein [Gammaproteobacteria bacterium]